MIKTSKDIRIVVLPAGWIVVGAWSRSMSKGVCTLTGAYVIRKWGTTAGLGEIALNGPTSATILDRAGIVTYPHSNMVLEIHCTLSAWSNLV